MSTVEQLASDQIVLIGQLLRALGYPQLDRASSPVAPIAEALLANAIDLEAMVAEPPPTGAPADDHATRRRAYEALVGRVREKVRAVVPAGQRYLVVTRGDGNLLLGTDRTGRHFPAGDDGRWIGYHPASSIEALAHLDRERSAGARWFVVPSTAFWWLEHYVDLHRRLLAGSVAHRDEDVAIFELSVPSVESTAKQERYARHVQALGELVRVLVPRRAVVLVASRGDDDVLRLGNVQARHFPATDDGTYAGQLADGADGRRRLAVAVLAGARFLAIPPWQRWWMDVYPDLADHLRRDHCCVADQAEAGLLFELRPPSQGAP